MFTRRNIFLQQFHIGVVLLSAICSHLFHQVHCASVVEDGSVKVKLSSYPKLVVLSYDGFRFDYMEKTDTPTLDRLKAAGVHSSHMRPQFPTKTFPNHMSIVTGLHAENHGIVDNQLYDPKYGFLSGYQSFNEEFWDYHREVVPVWILNELQPGHFSGASWPGSNHPFGPDRTFPSHYLTYNKSLGFEERMDYVVEWLTDEEKPANLVFMYFDEPDGEAHAFGPESPETIVQIQRMDKITQYLLDQLEEQKILDQVNIMIVSDHGFQEISLKNMISLKALVNESLYDTVGGTPVMQIIPKYGNHSAVYNALSEGSTNLNFSVYWKEEIPQEWYYAKSRRIGNILVVADNGYVFDDYADRAKVLMERFNLPYDEDRKFGVHGYDNRAGSMQSFFLAYGPAFKKGVEISPFDNLDLFPLMCQMVNVAPSPHNGTLETVRNALLDGSGGGIRLKMFLPNLLVLLGTVQFCSFLSI